jgi:hypothetical protein
VTEGHPRQAVRAVAFYSVDIVNSAAYKGANPQTWPGEFRTFFGDFPCVLSDTCGSSPVAGQALPMPVEWKKLGDELTYTVDLGEAFEAIRGAAPVQPYELIFHYTLAMTLAIATYNRKAEERLAHGQPAFKVKGAAWFANVEHEHRVNRPRPDFVGPQVDIGFRISKYSDLSRFVVSVEYAILLLRDNYLTVEDNRLDLHYAARQPIKGPLEKLGYPIIYIDMSDPLGRAENRLLSNHLPVDRLDLMRFMQEYLKRAKGLLQYPFVHDEDPLFCDMPLSVTSFEL